jgi:SAM-dependent methyltransferase
MVSKEEGWNVKYLDLVDTEVLIERARNKNANLADVPTIDYVYDPAHLISETVADAKFDFVVSSHVIEHIPDLILHFQDIGKILNPGGVYCFIVPDMALCFDAKKTPSSLGQLIEAFVVQHRQAPLSAMIDEFKYGVKLNNQGAWSTQDSGNFTPKYDYIIGRIKKLLENPASSANWHGHIWRFTPDSFASIYADCQKLDLVELELIDIQPTSKMEFLVVLQKSPLTHAVFG